MSSSASLSVFGADLACLRIIQAVYSGKGFSLSCHLALRSQPLRPALHHTLARYEMRPLELEDTLLLRCSEKESEGVQFTQTFEFKIPESPSPCLCWRLCLVPCLYFLLGKLPFICLSRRPTLLTQTAAPGTFTMMNMCHILSHFNTSSPSAGTFHWGVNSTACFQQMHYSSFYVLTANK